MLQKLRVEHVIVTIKDVAQRAGVSPKTVSRVLNNETHVRPQLRETVMRVIEELNYKPNMFARGLSSARSYLIGLFIYDPYWSGYATDIQLGALRRCRELGYHLVIEPIDPFVEGAAQQVVESVAGLRLDGVILPPPLCTFEPLLSRIEEMGMPYVRISPGQDMDRSALVEIDEFAAAHDMTRHLIGLGHRDIGFVEGIPTHAAAARRYAGFEAAMAEAGLTVNRDWVLPGLFTFQSGFAATDELLSRKAPSPPPCSAPMTIWRWARSRPRASMGWRPRRPLDRRLRRCARRAFLLAADHHHAPAGQRYGGQRRGYAGRPQISPRCRERWA
jgi:LacI family transcriptional regulator